MSRRFEAVQATLREVRGLRSQFGPSLQLVRAVQRVLADLALRDDLFDQETFKVDEGAMMTIYELNTDDDGRLGLYASAGMPGKYQYPHDHRTWSVIAGVRGAEHNEYFERVDDGRDPTQGRLRRIGERTLRRGDANGMMGDAFHTIRVLDEGPALHLHLYGYPLDRLTGRVYFESVRGGVERPFMGRPDLRTATVGAAELAAMCDDSEELTILDVRSAAEHASGHVPGSCPVPLEDLARRAAALMPRRTVRTVIVAATGSEAHRAGHLLRRRGHSNLAVLRGGIDSWSESGCRFHDGIHPLPKAFGEHVAHLQDVPMLNATDLLAMRTSGQPVVVADCRPHREFIARHVPGAIHMPGTELLARLIDLDLNPETTVAVSCAGRTRSIVGAQSLIDAGVNCPIFALENGTMGWELAGEQLESGDRSLANSMASPQAMADARRLANQLAERASVPVATEADLATWRHDRSRTTYVFDVSLPDAYRRGHRPRFASAPGGQLVQELTARTAVPTARIVVADSDGIQALLTAYWLRLMGREAYAMPDASRGHWLESGDDTSSDVAQLEKPYEFESGRFEAMQAYIDWELNLVDHIKPSVFNVAGCAGRPERSL